MKKWFAVLLVLGSTVLFGITPSLIRLSYERGNNATNAALLQSMLAIPILLLILKKKRLPILPEKSNWKIVFSWMGLCMAITSVFLTRSYAFIPVGIATVLHFIYPTMVAVFGMIIFKQRLNTGKVISLVLCLLGICFFIDKGGSIKIVGVILALISGIAYSLYIVGLDHPQIQDMHFLRIALYMNISVVIVSGIVGVIRNEIVFAMPLVSWVLMLICALFAMVIALSMFTVGAKEVGGFTSAILSTLEPITSLISGWLFFRESIGIFKLVGCVLIISSIVVITKAQEKV